MVAEDEGSGIVNWYLNNAQTDHCMCQPPFAIRMTGLTTSDVKRRL